MTEYPPGLRPAPAEKHLPSKDVRTWLFDSLPLKLQSKEGVPLPRQRFTLRGVPYPDAHRIYRSAILKIERGEVAKPEKQPGVILRPEDLPINSSCQPIVPTVDPLTVRIGPTVAEYYERRYLPAKKLDVSVGTISDLENTFRKYVIPTLGHLPLEEAAKPAQVDRLREHLNTCVSAHTNKPLKSKNKLLRKFKTFLLFAYEEDLLLRPPKVKLFKEGRQKVEAFTADEAERIWKGCMLSDN